MKFRTVKSWSMALKDSLAHTNVLKLLQYKQFRTIRIKEKAPSSTNTIKSL